MRFDVPGMGAAAFVERCHALGVHMLPGGHAGVRAVMHLSMDDAAVDQAIRVVGAVLREAAAA